MRQDLEAEKKAVAARAVSYVRDHTIVGLGTGTTSRYFVELLADRVRGQGLSITAVATSGATAELATSLGLAVRSIDAVDHIDMYVDGVDEIAADGAIIKGGGGALLREKIVAANSNQRVYIADSSKPSQMLGKVPVPVEVVPFGHEFTGRRLAELGAAVELRNSGSGAFRTDSGNLIYDCKFENIPDPARLADSMHRIPGVIETGLFIGLGGRLITVVNGGVLERPG